MFNSCIYNGNVIHKRFKPKEHFFKYKVFSLFIDLSELNELNEKLKFLDELIQLFPTEPSFIIIRIFVNDKIPVKDVIGRFMKECLPVSRALKERKDDFFVYSDLLFFIGFIDRCFFKLVS